MVGTFQAEIPADEVPQSSETVPDTVWVTKYGLKASSRWQKTSPTMILTISVFHAATASGAAT